MLEGFGDAYIIERYSLFLSINGGIIQTSFPFIGILTAYDGTIAYSWHVLSTSLLVGVGKFELYLYELCGPFLETVFVNKYWMTVATFMLILVKWPIMKSTQEKKLSFTYPMYTGR